MKKVHAVVALIGLARNDRKKVPAAPAVVTNRHQREGGA